VNDRNRIATALLALRSSVFVVMLVWTLDKFFNVTHASRVFETFYAIGGLERMAFVVLFFAAWPMLAACFALYYLRDLDTKWTLT